MKKLLPMMLVCALAVTACGGENGGENGGDTPQASQVNLNVSLPGDLSWSEGDAIGVVAVCNRGDKTGASMSKNAVARLLASASGSKCAFRAATDDDKLLSQDGDRSFKFYAAYPFPEGAENLKNVKMGADSVQTYSANPLANIQFTASANALNVMAPVNVQMATPYALLELRMPRDIVPGEKSTLKSITLSTRDSTVFLTETGVYNVETGTYTPDEKKAHNVTVNFPQGLLLEEKETPVYVAVAPFTIPEGGLALKAVTTTSENTIYILDSEAGQSVAAGTVMTWTNVIVPVSFPVVFPLGKNKDDEPQFTSVTQPRWKTPESAEGRWICPEQPSAYAQWHWGPRFEGETVKPYIEIVNNGYRSSPGVKGIWSGDYLEFNIPVKSFQANTTLNITFPYYGRQHPMFWDLEYLDGAEWKCNRTLLYSNLPAIDQSGTHPELEGQLIPCEATFISERGSNTISHDITFKNAVEEGYIKIRLTCVHGEYQNGGGSDTTNDYIRSTPWLGSNGTYGAPWYFANDNEQERDLVIDYAKK